MRRFWQLLAFALLALGGAAPALAQSGYIHSLSGSASVRAAGPAEPRALKVGDLIDRGQTISTGANSNAVVKFEDGQVVALGPNAAFLVQDYLYNKKDISASRAVFNVIQGGLRFITGVIGATNRNAINLRAGTTTIGIRGTDVIIHVDAVTQAVTAAVNSGAIAFTSVVGQPVLAQAGQAVTQLPGIAPVIVNFLAAVAGSLPGTAQASIANLNSATNIPVPTPVNVQVSANAVVLAALAAADPTNAALQQQAAEALKLAVEAAVEALAAAIAAGGNNPVTDSTLDPALGTTGTPTSGTGAGGSASPN